MPKRHHKALQSATKTPKTYTNRPRPGARRRRRRSAAPRQEVAGRARYVRRFLSKLGGEASPSLRWLRFCRRPFPLTTLNHPLSMQSESFLRVWKNVLTMSAILVTGATKRRYVSQLGSQNTSKIELEIIIKSISGGFAPKSRIL